MFKNIGNLLIQCLIIAFVLVYCANDVNESFIDNIVVIVGGILLVYLVQREKKKVRKELTTSITHSVTEGVDKEKVKKAFLTIIEIIVGGLLLAWIGTTGPIGPDDIIAGIIAYAIIYALEKKKPGSKKAITDAMMEKKLIEKK